MNFGGGQGYGRIPLIDLDNLGDPRRTKKIFSKTYFGLFIYLVATYASLFIAEIAILLIAGEEKCASILSSPVYSLIISSVCQYAVGFPLFLLLTKKIECAKEKSKSTLPAAHLFYSFLACQALMLIGNFIGLFFNGIIESLSGRAPENAVDALVNGTPVWLLFITVVIIAPLVEELVFRKIMIDRLSIFGDRTAILYSAVAFGIFHGNFYQIFYAFFVGLVLGYVYTRTRNLWYNVGLHALLNFLGSVVSIYVSRAATRINEIIEISKEGGAVNRLEYGFLVSASAAYSLFIMLAFVGGAIVLGIFLFKRGFYSISNQSEIYIPRGKTFAYATLNLGAILFYITICVIILANLILPLIS